MLFAQLSLMFALVLAALAPVDLSALLAGLAGVGLTFLGGKLTTAVGGVDSRLSNGYKSLQPVIAGALGLALPVACQAIGLLDTCPSGEQLATAPLGTLVGISLIEATRRVQGKKRKR